MCIEEQISCLKWFGVEVAKTWPAGSHVLERARRASDNRIVLASSYRHFMPHLLVVPATSFEEDYAVEYALLSLPYLSEENKRLYEVYDRGNASDVYRLFARGWRFPSKEFHGNRRLSMIDDVRNASHLGFCDKDGVYHKVEFDVDSVAKSFIIDPILVRPYQGSLPGGYEVVDEMVGMKLKS